MPSRRGAPVTDASAPPPAAGDPGTGTGPAGGERSADGIQLILADDHRNSLERDLYGLTSPSTPAQAARISADKLIVYQALLDAADRLPAGAQPGILVDEQYGAGVAELAGRAGGVVSLSMPIEASGGSGSSSPTATTGSATPPSSPRTTPRSWCAITLVWIRSSASTRPTAWPRFRPGRRPPVVPSSWSCSCRRPTPTPKRPEGTCVFTTARCDPRTPSR